MPIMNEMKEWKEKRTVKNRIQSSEKKFNFIKAILEKKSADIESATLSTEAFTGTPPISSKSDISSQLKILQTQLKEKLQEEKQFSSVLVQEELATASLCENQVKCLLKMIDSLKIEIPKIVADELEEKKQAIYSNSDNARMDDEITLTTSSGKTKKVENEDGTINEMKSIPVEQEQIEDSKLWLPFSLQCCLFFTRALQGYLHRGILHPEGCGKLKGKCYFLKEQEIG
ncbi:uncharacterized protein MONOS_18223 [Monocercomonoides exilis]|uniref:uncharacterized protein n=1 Tax=Monocercomonoides exilis TaxID=2049356 RepID=UPI0035596065|nr:hypothetical protein MONOS_18223 [Monocercomonoides exilis]